MFGSQSFAECFQPENAISPGTSPASAPTAGVPKRSEGPPERALASSAEAMCQMPESPNGALLRM